MSAETLQAVDDAVRAFAVNLDDDAGGVCTGWVLIYTKAHYDGDEIAYCTNYAVSPDADPVRTVGIIEVGRQQVRAALVGDD